MNQIAPRSLLIKNLVPGLPERGKIKIGVKGKTIVSKRGNEFQPPQKLDHFIVTTMERGEDGNFKPDAAIHKLIGDKPKRIPVRLLFDDISLNFQSRYAAFIGKTLWCSGDGEVADRIKDKGPDRERVTCPCHRIAAGYEGADRCKFNGTLSVLVDGAGGVGGVWKFRTTSYNTVVGLMSSLALIKRITGGPLAGIPLMMVVSAKTAVDPAGKTQTVYIVGLEYGGSVQELQDEGYRIALQQAQHHVRIEHIETEAKALLAAPSAPGTVFADEDNDEVTQEFYPEAAAAAAGATVSPPATAAIRPDSNLDALEQLIGPNPTSLVAGVIDDDTGEVAAGELPLAAPATAYDPAKEYDLLWQGALAEDSAIGVKQYWEQQREEGAPGWRLWKEAPDLFDELGGKILTRQRVLKNGGSAPA